MTEEEIRPIAEDYVEEYCHCPDGEYTDGSLVCAGIGTALIVSRQLEKHIAELEKENAELSMKRKAERKIFQGIVEKKNDQLTKAKEIIKDLLGSENTSCEEEMFFEIRQKAEQFLKDNA